MSRLVAVDYGTKRIGVAITDPLKMFVAPFATIKNISDSHIFNELLMIFSSQQAEKIIIGLPLNLAGEATKKTSEVMAFFDTLKQKTDIPLLLWDERYSTADANEFLKQKGLNWKESRAIVDQVAAAVILKSYLDSNKGDR
jgi:putative Holliday junction resolvase